MFGSNVYQAVMASGVSTTGAAVHHVEADHDTVPVITQAEVPVLPGSPTVLDMAHPQIRFGVCPLVPLAVDRN